MRRGIAASALVAALAVTMAACGSSGSGSDDKAADGPVTITYWDTSNATNEAPNYEALVKKFEAANPNIKVKFENVPFDQAQNKLQTAMGATGAPDAFRSEVGWTSAFAKAGYLEPLDGTPAMTDKAAFQPSLIQQATYEGKVYGAPIVTDTLGLLYNKELFAKAGITKAPATWDELKTAAAQLKEKAGVDGFFMRAGDGYFAMPYLYGEGTNMVDAKGKKITVNSPEAVKAIETYKSMFTAPGTVKADVTTDSYAHMMDAFNSGKVAAVINGPWEITNIYKGSAFADKKNLGIAAVPAGSTGKAGAPTGGHNVSVYAGADKAHKAAAEKLAGFLTSAESQTFLATKNSTLPTRTDAYTADVKADPGIAGFQAILAAAQPRPELPEYSSLFGSIGTNLGKIVQDQSSTQAGLDATAVDYLKLLPGFSK
ncbi:arabinogalactan oligomer/maltooligosaccharide transport system substrate-binding protein [Kitasatospora gansuensis]|uniref:Arabinogalactan oligomer/maltooligosaccharide transport system substrate-binding protein n=1 Tax=Kitasatospora gansuensis TaxID=258050 RepID=A0A7W7SHJ4_9ACTN|nr:extracellular solute-binding protein [Kitasatospora gansuensis]MBB4950599.1 arabinogalactan oligomer/maltooligosaccharide transport system substrate-binding protein [Kitasatospora gansuensis]